MATNRHFIHRLTQRGRLHGLPLLFCALYLIPSIFPSLFRLPRFVVGIPVAFAIFRFADVMPNALFQLKDKPGINFFLAITVILSTFTQPLASVLRL